MKISLQLSLGLLVDHKNAKGKFAQPWQLSLAAIFFHSLISRSQSTFLQNLVPIFALTSNFALTSHNYYYKNRP